MFGDDFEMSRNDEPMNVWVEDGSVYVDLPESEMTRTLPPENARELADAFERYVENGGEKSDEMYQAEMLRRAADKVE